MKLTKTDVKKILIPSIIVILIYTAVFSIIIQKEYSSLNRIYDNTIEKIVGSVKEKYPEFDEEEIINILQSKDIDAQNQGKKLIEKYGYNDDIEYIENLKNQTNTNIKVNIIIFILLGITIIFIMFRYLYIQNKKVEEINSYLKKINHGNYKLKIEENTEDELSKLRNELYKTTIILREAADNNKKENNNLKVALEDISHQLKTPLTSIRIMIDNINENPNMDEETRKDFLKTISNQIDWISSLVISLLKLAKFDSGNIIMRNENIRVEDLINEAINNLSILIDIKNISIKKEIDKNAMIKVDYKWNLEAITNILKNSIEHSNKDSKIFIKVEDSSIMLKIIIQDYGEGIKKKDIKHIFERFYKADNSDANSIGIGLALSKAIIEKSNGYITVSSTYKEGTIFCIKYIK